MNLLKYKRNINYKVLLFLLIFTLNIIFGVNQNQIAYADENEKTAINSLVIEEDDYEESMKGLVEPYLNSKRTEGYFKVNDDINLYYQQYKVENSKGTIVISHGFTETLEKYKEMIYYFLNKGYSVYGIEHRGHGRSGSLGVVDESQIHIEDFNLYVSDFKSFIDDIVKPEIGSQKLFLFAHSMGGAIGTKFLEEYPGYFDAAILSAPMLEVNTGSVPSFLAKSISWICTNISLGHKYAPTQKPYSNEYNLEDSCTSSEARYKYYYDIQSSNKEFQRGGSSFSWLNSSLDITKEITKKENASKVEIPVLLFQAEKDTYVKPKGQNEFSQYAPNCKLILMVGSKHEVYREKDGILKAYLNQVFDFYNDNLSDS
ncbi:lysophospholipase [Clostridium botulinum]|uniref:alpha/beta fold hydrolase n=1 Tax=Clostridium botulinum TaxID=1491 RepID=UPI000174E84A|nr:alpha/beta hydrolase [Clostridium botulinum]ACD54172.1 lysophospholipase l2 pldb, hydrolase of alpha/beta superfamily [Clostridium botulinum E3 str. Alaska E43]AJF29812.1 lysophospholipase [Clostridium botulinum]AJF32873.1 lysophospholipase [Clostridium botulinum]MBN1064951.1 alpha/beta hydrolase [Clostridium botulinum]MBY6789015.1 alpha/beta hydrolase [Clostridium botulinum]